MTSTRTLLPVFSKTPIDLGPEPKEDFSFLSELRSKYEDFRDALDSVPGSREYLMNYVKPDNGNTFYDEIGNMIISRAGNGNSGNSVVALAWNYKNLLNDWDGWVKGAKIHQAKKAYKEAQLERSQTWPFSHTMLHRKVIIDYYNSDKDKLAEVDAKILGKAIALKAELSLPYSPEEIVEMMTELAAEFEKETADAEADRVKEQFESRLEVLEHHDKFPSRWDDYGKGSLKSALFNSIYGITPAMYQEMEKRRPGFTDRILAIIAASKS